MKKKYWTGSKKVYIHIKTRPNEINMVILTHRVCTYNDHVCYFVCICIDWFEKVHPHWEKIMYMYKQIQKKDAQLISFLFFFSFFVLSLFSIKFVDRKKRDKANSIVVASIDIRLASMHEHFISTSSHPVKIHLLNWNENGRKKEVHYVS